jgi:predicted porin
MTKNIKSLLISFLGLTAISSAAFAQNSLTLYGVLDNSLQYAHNVNGKSTQLSMVDSNGASTRWGLKGVEDLGEETQAIFVLENGYNLNTGAFKQGGRMFGRQAFVGLTAKKYGALTLGRQYDALKDLVYPVEGYVWLTPGDVDDAIASIRMSNVVKWSSPAGSALNAVATYAFGGVPGALTSGETYSAAIAYGNGPARVAAGYMHIDYGNAVLSSRGTSTADSLYSSVINKAYASAKSISILRGGADYTFGQFSLFGYYSVSEYSPDGSSTFKRLERYNNASIVAQWQISVPLSLRFGYQRLQTDGDSSARYHQFTLAENYSLSKRTDLYASETYEHASGSNGLGPAQAVVSDTTVTGNSSVILVMVGILHRF